MKTKPSNIKSPPGWTHTSFLEIVLNLDGKRIPVKRADRAKRQGIYPYYGASGVIDYIDDYLFDGPHLLIAEDGANLLSRTTPIAFKAEGKFWVNNHAHVVTPLAGIPIAYLASWFAQTDLSPFITGSAQPKLTQKALNNLQIPLPPLNEQRRITAKIEALQTHSKAAQEALDAVPTLLDRFRKSVLAAAFRGDLTREWREANPDVEPASVLLERIRVERKKRWIADYAETYRDRAQARALKKGKDWTPEDDRKTLAKYTKRAHERYEEPEPVDEAELPDLPRGWCWSSVEALCWDGPTNGYSGKTASDAVGTLSMKLSATTQGQLIINEDTTKRLIETVDQDSKYWLESGDLLVQRANSLEYLGTAALYHGSDEAMIYPDLMIRLRTSEEAVTTLLWRYFNSPHCRERFRSLATGTAGNMPKINGAILKSTPVPIPTEAEIKQILQHISRTFESINTVSSETEALDKLNNLLNQSILAKAFRGELVPQDPNAEPASVLLERIQAERKAAKKQAKASGKSKRRSRKSPATASKPSQTSPPQPLPPTPNPEPVAGWSQGSLFGGGATAATDLASAPTSDLSEGAATILACLREASEPLGRGDVLKRLEISASVWTKGIKELVEAELVVKEGERRGAKYQPTER
ncbi:MAG: hypothetical protein CMH57_14065 [Myxococcales bacterium]|nr:hypothetical protein [Myxococcales bacterium]